MPTPRDYNKPITPTPATVTLAQNAIHQLGTLPAAGFALVDHHNGIRIALNEQVFDMLRSILIDMAQNRPIAMLPLDHELTTHQAAEVLNVSRNFIIGLIDKKELPCRMVGTHRRIRLEDLLAYQDRANQTMEKAAQALTDLGQEMGLD